MADAPDDVPRGAAPTEAAATPADAVTAPADAVTAPADEAAVRAARVIEATLEDAGLAWESPEPGGYVVTLPGTRKLSTTCSLRVGKHSLSLNAFVVRHPDENDAAVHRWLLERNLRLFGVSYAIDRLGDIYLTGRLPLSVVTPEELDRLLGTVLEAADGSFNTLLELGFASSIRKEYEWRVSRGESTRNLDAFAHLTRRPAD
ncbi:MULTISPECIES: YbjN domain-containing protein [unclassified Streptomyces]|uniref:YbjN domain-containing protein n=1 Tax=unclassified Streptomyces TaxID=2593676 RepID=UPI00292A4054|nr:YbjN domain-containing protein [Streptomyces sp. sk2.1]